MKMRHFYALGLVTFLLAFSTLIPVIANGWGNPLATDPANDPGADPEEDINSVDAQYSNGFVYFRFIMNYYIIQWIFYGVYVDLDKNISTGFTYSPSDVGCDFYMYAEIMDMDDFTIEANVGLYPYPAGYHWVSYNLTAYNFTEMDWSSPEVIPYFDLVTVVNSSQSEIVFGVNWNWITNLIALEGITGDNCSMYLEFIAGWDTDWCPDRTVADTDYIEWDLCLQGGIPGFSTELTLFSLLTLLGAAILLYRNRIKL